VESWPLHWQIGVTVATAILASGAVAAFVSGLFKQPKIKAEARKLEIEADDKAAEIAWETVERLRNEVCAVVDRLDALEEEDRQLRAEYRQLKGEHQELRERYRVLQRKSEQQEKRIQQLERELEESCKREKALRELLLQHGIDPNGEIRFDA